MQFECIGAGYFAVFLNYQVLEITVVFEVLIFYELYLSCIGSKKVQLIETGSFCLETHKQIYEKNFTFGRCHSAWWLVSSMNNTEVV